MPQSVLVIAAHPDDEVWGCCVHWRNSQIRVFPSTLTFLVDGTSTRSDDQKIRSKELEEGPHDFLGDLTPWEYLANMKYWETLYIHMTN